MNRESKKMSNAHMRSAKSPFAVFFRMTLSATFLLTAASANADLVVETPVVTTDTTGSSDAQNLADSMASTEGVQGEDLGKWSSYFKDGW